MRNTLYKAYLDDFASFCEKLGGTTSEVMSDLLAFEADRRALNITLNRWACRGCFFVSWVGIAVARRGAKHTCSGLV
jgi:hypothetical protein